MTDEEPQTVIEAISASLGEALRSPDGVASPAALLWTDADGQWSPLLSTLQHALPQLYVLGTYAPEGRSGPVIWLRCIVERTLTEISPPEGVVPILYLAKISRQDLRAAGDCPAHLQPLIELQYRGAVWHQRNGRDWTVEAFLNSDDALGLDIARDNRTRDAMLRALPLLATEPVAGLRGRRLEADDFDRLAIGDPVRDILGWLSDAEAFQVRCDTSRWATFRDVCIRKFSFDPNQGGTQAAADALLHGGGKWDEVWQRFRDSPRLYPGVSAALRQARPRDLLGLTDQSRLPGLNEDEEDNLRKALDAVVSMNQAQACTRVAELDDEHKERRGWVWAQLGESPYAAVLEPLGRLARTARTALGGSSVEGMASDYAAGGWRCDRAAVEALAAMKPGPSYALVSRVVRAMYEPWLDRSARRFQELLSSPSVDPAKLAIAVDSERDTCVVFADGLRFDVGATLQARLEAGGFLVRMSHRIAPIPTVTATAKPVASPAHVACVGTADGVDFAPVIVASRQTANAARLRDAMRDEGVEILAPDQASMAMGSEGGGWTEAGKLDTLGHSFEGLLVRHIDPEIDGLLERVVSLLDCGWKRVRVVTDHGWLLLPGGLPKVELSPHLVATKWSRCAVVKGQSPSDVPTYPWYWNPVLRIASPPGIGSFIANTEYSHGGVSLQECVIPDMIVERGEAAASATITGVTWRGMRCRVTVSTETSGLKVDLRLNWKQSGSSIAASEKDLAENGEAGLTVSDDSHEGAAASVVVFDSSGRVLHFKPTTVGEDQ